MTSPGLLPWLRAQLATGFVRGVAAVTLGWALHHMAYLSAPVEAPVLIAVQATRPPQRSTVPVLDSLRSDSGFVALVSETLRREGFRSHIYDDGGGNRTIGYGWNLDAGVSEDLGRLVAEYQLAVAFSDFRRTWPPFASQPRMLQLALTAMGFQLGVTGAERFDDMLGAIQRRDVSAAVREIRNSDWYDRTPVRAEDLIRVIRGSL